MTVVRTRELVRATPRGLRRAAVVALLSLIANGALLVQINRSQRPEFERGGEFIRRRPSLSVGTPPPGALALEETATPTPSPEAPGRRPTTRLLSRSPTPPPRATPVQASATGPAETGVYTYRVQGTETATGFGSRPYPQAMTLEVHRRQAAGKQPLRPDEVVFDLDFQYTAAGEGHTEREVVAYRPDGLYFTAESGQISFRGFGRQSDADYDPPMLQVPLPPAQGAPRTGRSRAVSPDRSVSRTEDWSVQVLRRETIKILDQDVDTWVVFVHRVSNPDAAEKVQPRDRTYWYDPARRIWVRWQEKFHGEQSFGVTFTYDTDYTATLAGFAPK